MTDLIPRADAVAVRTCVSAEPSFGAMYDGHAHIELQLRGRPIACAVIKHDEIESFRRTGVYIEPVRGSAPLTITWKLEPQLNCKGLNMDGHVPQASSVTAFVCQHGKYHLELKDADGRTLGLASFDAEGWAKFIGDGCDLLEIGSQGGLALQPCEGVA
jgi:hypothetical protein